MPSYLSRKGGGLNDPTVPALKLWRGVRTDRSHFPDIELPPDQIVPPGSYQRAENNWLSGELYLGQHVNVDGLQHAEPRTPNRPSS